MARSPMEVLPPNAPFSNGLPPDDFEVEALGEDEVLIGNPALDSYTEPETAFDQNLAEVIDEDELGKKAANLIQYYESDKNARSQWEERYKDGLKTLDPQGGLEEGEDERASRGLSTVVHPLIAEAATQFNSRAIVELYPSGGPVKTVIVGEPNEETEAQARRVRDYMNYQITEEMPEYFPDLDQMLFQLPLVGQTFKKIYWDASLNRQCSQFVKAEDFVVAPESKDLFTSPRYTQVIRLPKNDYNKYVKAGWYLPSVYQGASIDPSDDVTKEIEGVDIYSDDQQDEVMTLLEMHVYETFDGIDGEDDENIVAPPYVVTIDYDSEKIVSVRRNWDEGNERKKRVDWFISYKFLPGVGFYGFGLYHMIGGLGKVATGALRALLDSAAFANMQGGFKLRGRVSGGEIDINPGEFVDLDSTVDDVNKAIMPLPFKEPSGTLFQLLGFIVQAGQRFASTADLNVGDVNPNAPVGSTVALIEQGSKQFSAIHKRLHYSQGQEFKMLSRINAIYLPDTFNFAVAGSSQTIHASDFNDRVDIVPVSDPNIFSTAQRIAQSQAILQMAIAAPELHDLYEAYKRMYEAIRIPNIDEILIKPAEAPKLDPIDENFSVMYGKPINAFPEQDHDAHIAVHLQFLQDPSLAGNQAAGALIPVLIAHVAEHVALLYRQRMQASISVQLPDVPNLRDPKFMFKDISPELDMMISQQAAQVVQQAPQMAPIKALQELQQGAGQEDPMQYAKQLAEMEAQAIQMRTQAEIQAKEAKTQQDITVQQAKAQTDIAIDQAKAQQDLAIQQAKVQADLQAKVTKLEAELQIEREKQLIKAQMEVRDGD